MTKSTPIAQKILNLQASVSSLKTNPQKVVAVLNNLRAIAEQVENLEHNFVGIITNPKLNRLNKKEKN